MKTIICNLILVAFVVLVAYTLWSMKQECGTGNGAMIHRTGEYECIGGAA